MPTIQLPKFSGSYENWLEFRDSFNSLIHCNDTIDEINKFHYLRASLEGPAAVVIQSFEFSASNYSVAWNVLCERYDNKRLLIQNHISALFNIDNITKESSVSLKRLIDSLNKHLRSIDLLGEPVTYWGTLLIYLVTHKLDQRTYREWEEFKGRINKEVTITFDLFLQFLRSRADLIESLEMSRSCHSILNKPNSKVRSMVTVQNLSPCKELRKDCCVKCKGDHSLIACSQFLALSNDDRLKLMPSFKVCYNCFKSGHYANQCKRPGCKMCKRRHHTLIHVTDKNNSSCSTASTDSSQSSGNSMSTTSDTGVSLSVNLTHHSDVILSTALIKLTDCNNVEHIARAVLDSGSTSSFITEKMSQKLNLNLQSTNKSIMGIGKVVSHVGKKCCIHFKSLDENYSSKMNCYILPSITSNVPSRGLNLSSLNIPSHLSLADPTFYKPSEIDILIGADLFWDLLGSKKINLGSNKPTLHKSKLGWIVSGTIGTSHSALFSNNNVLQCNFTNCVHKNAKFGIKNNQNCISYIKLSKST